MTAGIDKSAIERVGRLSPLQEGLLFHSLAAPGSDGYNVQFGWRMPASADRAALAQAWRDLMARHESLRTVFPWKSRGEPLRVVLREVEPVWEEADHRGLDEAGRRAAWDALLESDRRRGFNPARAPLMRLTLVGETAETLRVLWSFHHIVLDGWSVPLVLADLVACYEARCEGRAPELPPVRRFSDYVDWLESQATGSTEAYWREALKGFRTGLRLGVDRGPAASSPRRRELRLELDEGLTAELGVLARRLRVTPAAVARAAWMLLLGRLAGEEDVVVGTVVSGRPADLPGADAIVGMFLNTLPLRARLEPGMTLAALAATLQRAQGELQQVEHTPLVRIKEWSELPGDEPLFDTLVVFENYPRDDRGTGLLRDLSFVSHTHYPLHLRVRPGRRWSIDLVHDPGRFDEPTAAIMLDQYAGLLRQCVGRPEAPLEEFSLITEATRDRVPDPAAALAPVKVEPLAARVLRAALADPGAPAVEREGRSWSYGELARAAAGVAGQIAGVRGQTVAVTGERSFGLIAAMLGVLAGGGVLLTLDPRLPARRRLLMLEEARAALMFEVGEGEETPEVTIERLANDPCQAEGPDDWAEAWAALPAPAAGDAAYIFFTSGTTGTPKAVVGTHGGLAHFIDWQGSQFGIGPHDRAAQLTGLSFDVVLRDVFTPLAHGATLLLPGESEGLLEGGALLAWLTRTRATLIHAVPSLAARWLEEAGAEPPRPRLRWSFFAGEPLTGTLATRWRRMCGGRVANFYGPTETTLAKCWWEVPANAGAGVQPVGFPQPGAQALVLAGERRCGLLEPGEVVIRTPWRTLGYLNAPEEQAARFQLNRWIADPEDLVYRTGDRGRLGVDGRLELLGRLDAQVKIGGVRIEPGEVEAVLAEHPGVGRAVVMAREGVAGPRLVAWVVGREGAAPAPEELAAHCAARMPAAMVPAAFVILETLPVTANGKVDRAALPAPADEQGQRAAISPRTPAEEILAGIWEQILRVRPGDVRSSFFALGGHSLLVARLAAAIRAKFEVDPPLRRLYEAPTLERQAALVEELLLEQLEQISEAEARRLNAVGALCASDGDAERTQVSHPMTTERCDE